MRQSAIFRAGEEISMTQVPAAFSIPTRILLPIDFSTSSDAALQMAANLAGHFHAELCLLHVVPVIALDSATEYIPDTDLLEEATKRAEDQLAACVAPWLAQGLKARSIVEVGNDVVGNIMLVVEREHIDMMVMSTHGVSGWRAFVFGSIAEKLVRVVQCPLLLLQSPRTEAAPASIHSMAAACPMAYPIQAPILA